MESMARAHTLLNALLHDRQRAHVSGLPEHQPCYRRAGDQNQLRNFPAKQYGQAHRTDQHGGSIVNRTPSENDHRTRDRASAATVTSRTNAVNCGFFA